jgi:hypothetical protein
MLIAYLCMGTVGSVDNYTRRVIAAVCRLTRKYLKWPSEQERDEIKHTIGRESIFFDCIGFMDGTLIPFAYRPTVHGASDFFSRKHRYGMNALVICDPSKRFTYLLLGNAAAANDQAVASASDVCTPSFYHIIAVSYVCHFASSFSRTVIATLGGENMSLPILDTLPDKGLFQHSKIP